MTNNAFTRHRGSRRLSDSAGVLRPDPSQDVALLAYADRIGAQPTPGLGFAVGFGLRSGAIATSAAPDDYNFIGVGADPEDLRMALNLLIDRGGGEIVVDGGEVKAFLPLPTHGVLSDLPVDEHIAAQRAVNAAARELGCNLAEPMRFLGLLEITGVPDIGMSEHGPVDYASGRVLPLVNVS